jgi:predicted PurR-regulated permease PerM
VKRVAVAAAISLASLTAAALLWRFRGAAALFVVSLAVAAAVRPFVAALEPRLGRGLALTVAYVLGLAFLGLVVYVVSRGLLAELDDAAERLMAAYERLRVSPDHRPGEGSGHAIRGFLRSNLPPGAALYSAIGAARPTQLVDEALGLTRNVIDSAGELIIVIALSAYWTASREAFERLWLSMVPAPRRTRARDVWRGVESAVGHHLRSELSQSILAALAVALAFRIAHLPTPVLPALAAGVLRLVPFFGVPLAALASFLAGNARGTLPGLLAAAYTVVVLVVVERAVGRTLLAARRPSPTLTVVLAVALVDVAGALGLLLASTIAMALQVFVERLIATHPRRARNAESLAQIDQRIDRVRQRLLLLPPGESAQLDSVVSRLAALASEARRAT